LKQPPYGFVVELKKHLKKKQATERDTLWVKITRPKNSGFPLSSP
jgi:hypothetical protein